MRMKIEIAKADAEKIIADEIRRRLDGIMDEGQGVTVELPSRYSTDDCVITVSDPEPEIVPAPETPAAETATESEAKE